MAKKKIYSFLTGLKCTLKNAAIILIPVIAAQVVSVLPSDIANMSVGAFISFVLYMIKNWLANKSTAKKK